MVRIHIIDGDNSPLVWMAYYSTVELLLVLVCYYQQGETSQDLGHFNTQTLTLVYISQLSAIQLATTDTRIQSTHALPSPRYNGHPDNTDS